ncbi:MAG: TIGR03960 family B12-binding radical SAM protein [Eggerthellaceae bacterium]|nr:TIGR03960 family B12-binding radical SAM protein [Eggerthellaceae bacterium]
MRELWPRLAALLGLARGPGRYIDHEWGAARKPQAGYHFCMVYPDTYELGQANQAVRILCNVVNGIEGMGAERAFLPAPDFCAHMRAAGLPLFSLESCAPLADFDALGITLSHELAATNVLETLDLAGISLRSVQRFESEPLIIAGGPCCFNPEPLAPFIDVFVIGEGEEAIVEVLELHRSLKDSGLCREEILKAIAALPGCYVPSLYRLLEEDRACACGFWLEPRFEGVPRLVTKRVWEGFAQSSAWEPCIVPYTEVVHDRLNIEVQRGCSRGCRFCQAGMSGRPVRERSCDNIVQSALCGLAQTGYEEVSLTSLSTTDHSQIEAILSRLNRACAGKGMRVSIPSQRLDAFGVALAGLVAGQKKGGLTFAPEAGTQRLRDAINKSVCEEDLFAAIEAAFAAGWRSCKLYFMVGLPTETDEDILGIASLAQRVLDRARAAAAPGQRNAIKISLSCALFVPKPQTPFQWDGQIAPEEALRRIDLIRRSLQSRAISVHWHDPRASLIEALLSRGGRECADLIEGAWKRGAAFDAWTEHFDARLWEAAAETLGMDMRGLAGRDFDWARPLPWAHISSGVSPQFLRAERLRAESGEHTPDCSFGPCSDCGVCSALGLEVDTVVERGLFENRGDGSAKSADPSPEEDANGDGSAKSADPSPRNAPQAHFRLRVFFQESGRLAMLSHLELARALERAVRRSQLPFAVTEGFSPHMKIAFGAALPVGVGGLAECFDLSMTRYVPTDAALEALRQASVEDLMVYSCEYIGQKAPAASLAYPRSVYEAVFSAAPGAEFVVPKTVVVRRKSQDKELLVSDYLEGGISRVGERIEFTLCARPSGSLRPDDLVGALLQQSPELELFSITRLRQCSL